MMTIPQAVAYLREKPQFAGLIRDAYLDADVVEAARRFTASAEFCEVIRLVGDRVRSGVVLDLGAGAGVASYAFAIAGAKMVYAVEPQLSDEVGAVARWRMAQGLPIYGIAAIGEQIPLPDASVDVVFARQVLHHIPEPALAIRECTRVLRRGGALLATREHVVDNHRQRREFLASHPIHALAGGENAFPLSAYRRAFLDAGLNLVLELGPWDSIINAFPEVRTAGELDGFPRAAMCRRLGLWGRVLSRVPGTIGLTWKWLRSRRRPGRLFSFLAYKP
ncbi:MAG: methyltransferase domain-containing protein [Chloroflexota bacterium]|nr:methyltransferase domain-containing protein [Chloroflexota bacterium]